MQLKSCHGALSITCYYHGDISVCTDCVSVIDPICIWFVWARLQMVFGIWLTTYFWTKILPITREVPTVIVFLCCTIYTEWILLHWSSKCWISWHPHDEFHRTMIRYAADVVAIASSGRGGACTFCSGLRHIPRPPTVRSGVGGRVAFYIKRGVTARLLPHPPAPLTVEQVWLSLTVNTNKLAIGAAYRPQWPGLDIFVDGLMDLVTSFSALDHVMLVGDFNVYL